MKNWNQTVWKKLISVSLAAVMMLSFAACGSRSTPEEPEKPPVEQEQEQNKPEEDKEEEEPQVVDTPELGDKIAEMKAKNNDVVAWLQIPDTEINAAVVQTTNNDFYMRKNEMKEYSWTGSYFIDYECQMGPTRDDLYRSTIVYGHNVHYDDNKDKERFSQLFHFADPAFAKEHPYIYFSTPEDDMVWEVFAVAYTTTDFNYVQVLKDRQSSPEQITEAQMMNVVTEARARSEYDYPDVTVSGSDKILTLSTCSYKYGRRTDVRFIVMAKLLDKDAQLHETANIVPNEDKKTVA